MINEGRKGNVNSNKFEISIILTKFHKEVCFVYTYINIYIKKTPLTSLALLVQVM